MKMYDSFASFDRHSKCHPKQTPVQELASDLTERAGHSKPPLRGQRSYIFVIFSHEQQLSVKTYACAPLYGGLRYVRHPQGNRQLWAIAATALFLCAIMNE